MDELEWTWIGYGRGSIGVASRRENSEAVRTVIGNERRGKKRNTKTGQTTVGCDCV